MNPRHAIIALVVVNAMWGSSFPVMKCLNLQMDQHFGVDGDTASTWLRAASASWMIGIRFAIALVLFLLCYRGVLGRVRWQHAWAGIAIGTLFYFGLLLQVAGLATIPASRSGFLTSLAVVFTPLFVTLVRWRLPRPTVLLGATVALLGVSILTGMIQVDSGGVGFASDALSRWRIGDTITIMAVVFFSGQILLVDHFGKRYDSIAFTPTMFVTVVAWGLAFFVGLSGSIPETQVISSSADQAISATWTSLALQPSFLILVVLLSIFPSMIAFAMMNKYQPAVSASQAAVIYTLEPLCASAWAMFIPGLLSSWMMVSYANETFSVALVTGGALVFFANVLALWPASKATR